MVGILVGIEEGMKVGGVVGIELGMRVVEVYVGEEDGMIDGEGVGLTDGMVVGATEGDTVGAAMMEKVVVFIELVISRTSTNCKVTV